MSEFLSVKKFCEDNGLPFDGEIAQKLAVYSDYLLEYNRTVTLTAIKTPPEVEIKHFVDSLTVAAAVAPCGRVLDVGSGAGFPGVVLKLFYPDISLSLLDSNGKKIKFLASLCEKLNIEAELLNARAEERGASAELRESFDLVTARAVAQLNELCEYCLPFVRTGGVFAAMKGGDCSAELEQAAGAIGTLGGGETRRVPFVLPDGSARTVIVVRKISHTPPQYPRNAAKIAKKPL